MLSQTGFDVIRERHEKSVPQKTRTDMRAHRDRGILIKHSISQSAAMDQMEAEIAELRKPQYVGVREMAEYLECTQAQVLRYKRDGKLPPSYRLDGMLHWLRTDLDSIVVGDGTAYTPDRTPDSVVLMQSDYDSLEY